MNYSRIPEDARQSSRRGYPAWLFFFASHLLLLLWPASAAGQDGSSQLSLPWPTNTSYRMTWGPHLDNGVSGAAIDFNGAPQTSVGIYAAREGKVRYGGCQYSVWVDHDSVWSTNYYHITNIQVANGQQVARGTLLGYTSIQTCTTTPPDGHHVHFTVTKNGAYQSLNGLCIGGWLISAGATNGGGTMSKNGQTVSVGGSIFNDGTIGCGTTQPIPSVTSVSPASPVATGAAQPFSINGINFSPTATVTLRDSTTTYPNRTVSSRVGNTQIVITPNFGTIPDNWSVEVLNGSASSGLHNFSVTPQGGTLAGKPTNPNPASGAVNLVRTPTLSWTPGSNTSYFRILLSNTSNLTLSHQVSLQGIQFPFFPPDTLNFSTTYYWRVDAQNSAGTWTSGDVWSFTTQNPPPPDPVITLAASPSAGGNVSGSGTFAAGSQRTVTATANSGYTFTNWTEGGGVVSTSTAYTFTLNANRSLVANFTTNPLPRYTLNVSVSPPGAGSVVRSPSQTDYAAGSVVSVTAQPGAGWRFVNWVGSTSGTSNPASVTLNSNLTAQAVFEGIPALGLSPVGGIALPAAAGVSNGTSQAHLAVINQGQGTLNWTASSSAAWLRLAAASGSVPNGGSLSELSYTWDANAGASVRTATVTITAAGVAGSPKTLTFTQAGMAPSYTLTVSSSPPEGGSVGREPSQSAYSAGSTVIVTATPALGWRFDRWAGSSVSTSNPLTVILNGNQALQAQFVGIPVLGVSPTEGVNLPAIAGTAGPSATPVISVINQGQGTLNWTANSSASWLHLTATSGSVPNGGSLSEHSYSWDANPGTTQRTASLTITAAGVSGSPKTITFVQAGTTGSYDVTTTAMPAAGGSITGGGSLSPGQSTNLTATANAGYYFDGWDGDASGFNNPLSVGVTRSLNIRARFQPVPSQFKLVQMRYEAFPAPRFRMGLVGPQTNGLIIERSTDLKSWSPWTTLSIGANGFTPIEDTTPPPGKGYYRAKEPQSGPLGLTLNFDDNQLPPGWSLSFPTDPRSNGGVANQRFESREVDTAALLTRAITPPQIGNGDISCSWRCNIINNFWGMGTGFGLKMQDGSIYSIYAGKRGSGYNHGVFSIRHDIPADTFLEYYSDIPWGEYRTEVILNEGVITLKVISMSTQSVFYYQQIQVPSLHLANAAELQLMTANTTGPAAWMDDVIITVSE